MTAPAQPELFAPKPGDYATEVAWLEHLLDMERDWLTAAEILQRIGRPVTDDNKRWVRNVANRAECVLSGPGSPGYKHMKHCKIEDIVHYARALIAQGKEMIRRGIKLIRNAHKIFGL